MSAPRILVVDDDAATRRLVSYILCLDGFVVDQASGGEEALRKAATFNPEVLILDIEMPDLNGRDVFHRLRAAEYFPKILILSVDHADEICRDLLADASLRKPFLPEELVEKVRLLTFAA